MVQVGVRHKHRLVVHCALHAATLQPAVLCRTIELGTARAMGPWHTCGQRPVSNTSLCRGKMMQVSWPAMLMPSTSTPARVKGACLPALSQWRLGEPHVWCLVKAGYLADSGVITLAVQIVCVTQRQGICFIRTCDHYSFLGSAPGAAGPSCAMLVHARWQACRLLRYERLGRKPFEYDLACRRPQRSMQRLYGNRALALCVTG